MPGPSLTQRYKDVSFGAFRWVEAITEVSEMKGLILAALVGFVLAITLALPFTEDEAMAYNDALGEIRNEVTQRYGTLMLTLVDKGITSKKKKNG